MMKFFCMVFALFFAASGFAAWETQIASDGKSAVFGNDTGDHSGRTGVKTHSVHYCHFSDFNGFFFRHQAYLLSRDCKNNGTAESTVEEV